ncbi:hypothetical protein, partial [Snodgrassella alvi]|uniref:hypothetical protein n=1 Tax=Snodgrassella alvi TaxID=1196083 RepID=UPI001C0BFB2A
SKCKYDLSLNHEKNVLLYGLYFFGILDIHKLQNEIQNQGMGAKSGPSVLPPHHIKIARMQFINRPQYVKYTL